MLGILRIRDHRTRSEGGDEVSTGDRISNMSLMENGNENTQRMHDKA